MTGSGELNKHTFLSRVFGMNSTYNPSNSNPMLNDDNNDLRFSINNLQDNFEEEEEDDDENDREDEQYEDNNGHQPHNYGRQDNPYYDQANAIMNNRANPYSQSVDTGSVQPTLDTFNKPLETPKLQNNTHQQQRPSINLNSEDEGTSSDSESNSESEHDVTSNDGLLFDQKQEIREQLQSEMIENDDEEFDTVPESLLMEGLQHRDHNHIHHHHHQQPPQQSTRQNLTSPPKKSIKDSFLEQIAETERSITPNLTQFGEKAKELANKTFHNLPKSIPKGISFQLPNHASSRLPPPPTTTFRKNNQSDPQTNTSNEFNNMNEQRQLRGRLGLLSPMERALWLWSNVTNLDRFLEDVYSYYIGNGYQCILLSRIFDLLIIIFVVWISSFMGNCVDYHTLMNVEVTKFSEVRIDQCYSKISFLQKSFYFILFFILILRMKTTYDTFKDLKEIKNFYNLLLNVSDDELQTISWSTIVKKIMILRDQNTNALISGNQNLNGIDDMKSKTRLNAHDIANRLMRKENYMIAIFNKNILNNALTIPVLNTYFLTKTLEWNLKLCIFDFIFNSDGQLKQSILNEHKRLSLSTELRNRFRLAGILSIFLTPFLVIYFLLYFFLKFFYDIKTDPSIIGSREYSPHARWKLREFNELPHIFSKRLKLSREGASNYINQFPKEVTNIIMKFVSFVTGSLVAILVILTVLDHENFLNFELTEGRTVLFYISTLGAAFTISKGLISADDIVFDPEASLRYVAQFTHYLPSSWDGKYHTESVKNQFCAMFNLRLVLVMKEIASLIMLPYILYYKLPESSEKVIDFFREFSVHVDGLGYVCTFAMFNFDNDKDKPINMYSPSATRHDESDPDDLRKDYYSSNDDKMVKSYLFFLESYGNEPVRQQQPLHDAPPPHTGKQNTRVRTTKPNGMNKSLLKSAIMNNSVIDRRQTGGTAGVSSVRYPPQFKHQSINNSMYFRGNNNPVLEDTTAGLSKDTKNYLNNLNNSMLLGESFQQGYPASQLLKNDIEYNYPRSGNGGGGSDNINSDDDDDDDDDDDHGNGEGTAGVLGLINHLYNQKSSVR